MGFKKVKYKLRCHFLSWDITISNINILPNWKLKSLYFIKFTYYYWMCAWIDQWEKNETFSTHSIFRQSVLSYVNTRNMINDRFWTQVLRLIRIKKLKDFQYLSIELSTWSNSSKLKELKKNWTKFLKE